MVEHNFLDHVEIQKNKMNVFTDLLVPFRWVTMYMCDNIHMLASLNLVAKSPKVDKRFPECLLNYPRCNFARVS
jgi:hypothetical protein